MAEGCCCSLLEVTCDSCEGIWVVCVRFCFPKPWTCTAFSSTEAGFCCLAKGPDKANGREQEDEDDEEESGMAKSLHSACLSSAVPVVGMGAAGAPGGTVFSAAVVTVAVAVLPSFLVLADAWQ